MVAKEMHSNPPPVESGYEAVWTAAQALPRSAKYRLIQQLTADLAQNDFLSSIQPGQVFEVWSPFDAYEAAQVLHRMMEEEQGKEA